MSHGSINGLTAEESKRTIEYIFDLIYRNHNTHVRFRWTNKNDFGKLEMPPRLVLTYMN